MADAQDDVEAVVRLVRARIEFDRAAGVVGYPVAGTSTPAGEVRAGGGASQAEAPALPVGAVPDAHAPVGSSGHLSELRAALGDCRRCKLAPHRRQVVFGVGNPAARLMFVGEGPGEDEDRQGEPFVGRAGKLLTEIITKGMRLAREDVYIANVVKCRPPRNRNPEPDEVDACEPFLRRQIELIEPEVIVALGKFAAQTLLRTKTPITRLRGIWHEYQGIRLMPTFHPAYLLRNPGEKRLVWDDVKQVMGVLGIPVAP